VARKEVRNANKSASNGANVGHEAHLWQTADALRGSMDCNHTGASAVDRRERRL